ncbi:MAG: M15 family metallopeptidase [Eubacteriales bacterium]|nr:M15 family metallopeptidase [Eubacteriales bacterium]
MRAKRILSWIIIIVLTVLLALIIYCRISGDAFSHEGNTDVLSASGPAASSEPTAAVEEMSEESTGIEVEPEETPETEPEQEKEPEPLPEEDPLPDIDLASWECLLVNAEHLLPSDFAPELVSVEDGQFFDARAVDALKAFVAAARAEGLTVYVRSSYRDYATQDYLYRNKVTQLQSWYGYDVETARVKACSIVAYPGSSEHQLGLACDIVDGWYEYMNESLADTALLKWMAEHCAEYGFILRYPEDKIDITGVMYEPWHFRYVGDEAAAYIMENGLCLEEFWELYASNTEETEK